MIKREAHRSVPTCPNSRANRTRRRAALALIAAITPLLTPDAHATTYIWDTTLNDAFWSTGLTPSGTPGSNDTVLLNQSGPSLITSRFDSSSPHPTISVVDLNATGAGDFLLRFDTDSPTIKTLRLGDAGKASLVQTNASVDVTTSFKMATTAAGGTATLTVTGGIFNVTANTATIGDFGAATVNVNGGQLDFATVTVGARAGASGIINVSSGQFLSTTSITLGNAIGATATANISGGSFYFTAMDVGKNGPGLLNITGGAVLHDSANTAGILNVATNSGATGTITLGSNTSTATLGVANNAGILLDLGGTTATPGGNATLTINPGGIVDLGNAAAAGGLTVGPTSTLNLAGGTLSTPSTNFSNDISRFNWTAGALHITNSTGSFVPMIGAPDIANIANLLTLDAVRTLTVDGTLAIGSSANLTLNSGTLSVGAIQFNNHTNLVHWNAGTLKITASSVGVGIPPATLNNFGNTLNLGANQTLQITNGDLLTAAIGTVNVTNGAHLSAVNAEINYTNPSNGLSTSTLTVSGTNSTLTLSGSLDLGITGLAAANINSSALVTTANASIASGRAATATVDHATWNITNNLDLGGQQGVSGDAGTLTINTGALVTVGGILQLYNSSSTLNLNGGELDVNVYHPNGNPSRLNWTTGFFKANSPQTNFSDTPDSLATGVTLLPANLVINAGKILAAKDLYGGMNTATGGNVNADNYYSFGATNIHGGVVAVTGNIGLTGGNGGLTVDSSGLVTATNLLDVGSGSQRIVTIASGGVLILSNNLTLNNQTSHILNINAGGELIVGNTLSFSGATPQDAINLNGGTLQVGSINRNDATFNFAAGRFYLTNSNLFIANGNPFSNDTTLTSDRLAVVTLLTTINQSLSLNVNSGPLTAFTSNGGILNNGNLNVSFTGTSTAAALAGGLITNNVFFNANGRVTNPLNNTSTGIVTSTGALTIGSAGDTSTNAGTITIPSATSITFNTALNNTGVINTAANASITFKGPVTSTGTATTHFTGPGAKVFSATAASSLALLATTGSTRLTNNTQVTADAIREDTLFLEPGAKLTLRPNGTAAGVSRLANLTGTGVSGGVGTLDLTNNTLLLDYSGQSPLPVYRAYILNAYAPASPSHWTGPGITSSTAAANPTATGVGYAEISDLFGISPPTTGTYRGQPIDATTILFRYTLLGDSTLDGAVDFNDLVQLAQNYNITDGTRTWFTGDYTYDGNVDFSDLVKLAQNYNSALPTAPIPGAPANFELDLAKAFAAVPEPAPLFPLLAFAATLLPRRRRPLKPN